MTENQTNKPFGKIVLGTVHVAIWKNTSDKGHTYYSLSIQNSYRDANGDFKPSSSYSRDDALVLAEAMKMAYHRVHAAQTKDRGLDRATALTEEKVSQHINSPEQQPVAA